MFCASPHGLRHRMSYRGLILFGLDLHNADKFAEERKNPAIHELDPSHYNLDKCSQKFRAPRRNRRNPHKCRELVCEFRLSRREQLARETAPDYTANRSHAPGLLDLRRAHHQKYRRIHRQKCRQSRPHPGPRHCLDLDPRGHTDRRLGAFPDR